MASGALSIPNRQIDGWLKRKVRKILDTTDGNVYGTEGCVGLLSNPKAFYDAIGATAVNASIILEVIR